MGKMLQNLNVMLCLSCQKEICMINYCSCIYANLEKRRTRVWNVWLAFSTIEKD